MGHALRSGVSFCRVAGRLMFLDAPNDRYFCLSPVAEESFRRLAEGREMDADQRRALNRLEIDGLLEPCPGSVRPLACAARPPADESLLDLDRERASLWQLAAAGFHLATVPAALRLRGFGAVIARTRRLKARPRSAGISFDQARHVACAFERTSDLVTAHDRCLARSIAIARRLLALGGRPDLIIGVKLQPFRAHCWVQLDRWLVNDRAEIVRDFTPILIV